MIMVLIVCFTHEISLIILFSNDSGPAPQFLVKKH